MVQLPLTTTFFSIGYTQLLFYFLRVSLLKISRNRGKICLRFAKLGHKKFQKSNNVLEIIGTELL